MARILTLEQAAVVKSDARIVKVNAGAGSGKTSVLIEYALARPGEKMLYLAYNKPIQLEAEAKFPSNVICKTTHSLAYPTATALLGKMIHSKLGNVRAFEVANAVGVEDKLAAVILQTVHNWFNSADSEIDQIHIPEDNELGYEDLPGVVNCARELWKHMKDKFHKTIKLPHDGYLKLFQLSRPAFTVKGSRFGTLLVDEFQDSNHCIMDMLTYQTGRLVLVGDQRQSIYAFRGAVNALAKVKADAEYDLTQSFRFGQPIADLANVLLSYFAKPGKVHKPLIGSGKFPDTKFAIDQSKSFAVIARTNAALFEEAAVLVGNEKQFCFVGGIANYRFETVLDAYHLSKQRPDLVRDAYLKRFATFHLMEEFGKKTKDREISFLVKVITKWGDDIPELIERIKAKSIDLKKDQMEGFDGVFFMTGHRSKGLEFLQVRLCGDFTDFLDEDSGDLMEPGQADEQEVNLQYVVMTRAMEAIELNSAFIYVLCMLNRTPGLVPEALWQRIRAAYDTPTVPEAVERERQHMFLESDEAGSTHDGQMLDAPEHNPPPAALEGYASADDDDEEGWPAPVGEDPGYTMNPDANEEPAHDHHAAPLTDAPPSVNLPPTPPAVIAPQTPTAAPASQAKTSQNTPAPIQTLTQPVVGSTVLHQAPATGTPAVEKSGLDRARPSKTPASQQHPKNRLSEKDFSGQPVAIPGTMFDDDYFNSLVHVGPPGERIPGGVPPIVAALEALYIERAQTVRVTPPLIPVAQVASSTPSSTPVTPVAAVTPDADEEQEPAETQTPSPVGEHFAQELEEELPVTQVAEKVAEVSAGQSAPVTDTIPGEPVVAVSTPPLVEKPAPALAMVSQTAAVASAEVPDTGKKRARGKAKDAAPAEQGSFLFDAPGVESGADTGLAPATPTPPGSMPLAPPVPEAEQPAIAVDNQPVVSTGAADTPKVPTKRKPRAKKADANSVADTGAAPAAPVAQTIQAPYLDSLIAELSSQGEQSGEFDEYFGAVVSAADFGVPAQAG